MPNYHFRARFRLPHNRVRLAFAASDEDLRRGLSQVSEALSPLERELARPASDRESKEDTP